MVLVVKIRPMLQLRITSINLHSLCRDVNDNILRGKGGGGTGESGPVDVPCSRSHCYFRILMKIKL